VGGQEAYLAGLKYLTLFNNPLTILYNLGFKFGLIFNAVKEMITYFSYP
jgi:hypothetical protein